MHSRRHTSRYVHTPSISVPLWLFFQILSNIHIPISKSKISGKSDDETDDPELYQPGLPVVAFRLSEKFRQANPNIQQRWIQVPGHRSLLGIWLTFRIGPA